MANKKKRKNKAPHARTAAPAERRQLISYDDVEEGAAPPVPRQKVSYASDSNSDHGQAPNHRHAVVSREAMKERERPQTDVTYGQTGAFPGLDARDKEPFYGPANDGLDYLRMVRSEARGIPHIVTAPPPDTLSEDDGYDDYYDDYQDNQHYGPEESEDEDQHGWYEDGAYVAPSIAAPMIGPVQPGMDAQDAFYHSLKTRFETLRFNLRTSPSVKAVQALDDDHPISLPYGNRAAEKEWKTHLLHTVPLPAQLASLDSQSILRLLKLAEGQLENCRSTNIPHNLSLWVWALLAKLEDVGLLQTRDVSVVRDLAKMAVWVRMMHHKAKYGRSNDPDHDYLDHYPDNHKDDEEDTPTHQTTAGASEVEDITTAQDKEDATTENKDNVKAEDQQGDVAMKLDSSGDLSDIIAAKKRQLQAEADAREKEEKKEQEQEREQQEFPDINTCVTIDMLVTVAAEFYGQKDLLVGRIPWNQPSD